MTISQNIAIEDSDIERAVREVKAMSQSVVHTFEEFIEQFYNAESVEEFRKGLADDPGLKANKLLRAATDPDMPPITDEEREAFYEEYKDKFVLGEAIRARHILVSCEPDADAETVRAKRAEAEECRKKLLEGADFAELAAEHSGCPSGEKGGRLFPFVRGTMLPEFEEAAFSREVGEIGELVTTEYGFHVIQVQSRTPAHTNTLAESTDLIDLVLDTRKREPLIEEYVESLRAKAEIVRTVAEE